MSRVYIFIVVMQFWLSGSAQPNAFLDVFNTDSYKGASVAYEIVDLSTKETLLELNSNQILIPASTQKLVTTAVALNILGDDFKFETKLYIKGEIIDSILYGDVFVVGGGDPTLGSRYFNQENPFLVWKNALISNGIKTINGKLIADDSYYSDNIIPDTWAWGDIGNYYGTGVSGLNYSDNTVFINFKSGASGEQTKINSVSPLYSDLIFDNRVLAANIRSDQAYVFGAPNSVNRYINGSIPQNRSSFEVKASIPNPGLFTIQLFKTYLDESGILSNGVEKSIFIKDSLSRELSIIYSPKLSNIVYQVNQHSINLFAEGIFRQLSKQQSQSGDYSAGATFVKSYLANKGLYTQLLFIKDGSGLSRFNGISPSTLVDVLALMNGNDTFYNSLPIAGVSGTLRNLLKDSHAENNLRAKSGSMERVRSYAGYVTSKSGKKLAFSIILNNYTASSYQVKKDLEEFMKLVSEL